jgi:ABC-type transport system involved in multi-copper enzyme maturation permease subunit
MNRTTYWRLVWKEYRLQRVLWIAMVLLTSLLLWLVLGFPFSPQQRTLALFWIAVALPAFYALGCGATLFAGEREAETYEFQRSLPVGARPVFAAKITLALAGMASLLGLMWLLAAWLSGWKLPDAKETVTLWATFGLFGLEICSFGRYSSRCC